MKSIMFSIFSVFIVLLLLTGLSYETQSKLKLTRKLFKELNKQIDRYSDAKADSDAESDENTESQADEFENTSELENTMESESEKLESLGDNKKQSEKNERLRYSPYSKEKTQIQIQMENWLSITSGDYGLVGKFPEVEQSEINLDSNYTRINDAYVNKKKTNGIPGPKFFWVRQNRKYIYYYANKKNSNNAIGTIYIDNIHNVRDSDDELCFSIIMKSPRDKTKYKICAQNKAIKKKWLCGLQKLLKLNSSQVCKGQVIKEAEKVENVKTKNVIQPMIIIPLAAKKCNEDWNYNQSKIKS